MSYFWNTITGIADPHTYQTTVIGDVISTDDKAHHYVNCMTQAVSGKYAVFSLLGNEETDHATYMYLYNYKIGKVTQQYNWGSYATNGDYHSGALVAFLPDGRIIMTAESNHNNQFVVKRSLRPYDITEYETIATINDTVAYNYMNLLGDRIYIICRSYPLIENAVRYSDDYGETWSNTTTILNTGLYASYWAYNRLIHNPNRIQYFMDRSNHFSEGGAYDKIYFLQSLDGINFFNIDNSYSRNITLEPINAADLETYYKVRDTVPAGRRTIAAVQYNNKPYYITQKMDDDEALSFGYHNGSAWAEKTISIVDVPLKALSRVSLLSSSENDFILYCTSYSVFAEAPNLESRVVKITTDDAFDTYSYEYLTDVGNYYGVLGSNDFSTTGKSVAIALTLGNRGTGPDVEPVNGYSDFTIVDVI